MLTSASFMFILCFYNILILILRPHWNLQKNQKFNYVCTGNYLKLKSFLEWDICHYLEIWASNKKHIRLHGFNLKTKVSNGQNNKIRKSMLTLVSKLKWLMLDNYYNSTMSTNSDWIIVEYLDWTDWISVGFSSFLAPLW